jgi:hypothetical protein
MHLTVNNTFSMHHQTMYSVLAGNRSDFAVICWSLVRLSGKPPDSPVLPPPKNPKASMFTIIHTRQFDEPFGAELVLD